MKEETLNLSKQRALQLWCDMLLVLLNIVMLLVLLMACDEVDARVGSGFEPRANSSTTSSKLVHLKTQRIWNGLQQPV